MNNDYLYTNPRQGFVAMESYDLMNMFDINQSAALVLKLIARLVRASLKRGEVDKQGIPYCYASKEWLAGELGKSLSTIMRAIRVLKAKGLIECKRTNGNARLFITGYGCPAAKVEASAEAEGAVVQAAEPVPEREAEGVAACVAEAENRREDATCEASFVPEMVTSDSCRCGTSDTSHITIKSNTIPDIPSINLSPRQARAERRERSAHLSRRSGKGQASEVSKERQRLEEQLRGQVFKTLGDEDMVGACAAAARVIAEAVAAKRDVRVGGVTMSAGQYWEVVRDIKGDGLCAVIKAIKARDLLGLIRNKRAYLLASVYNCALWGRFGEVDAWENVERLANGTGRRVWA